MFGFINIQEIFESFLEYKEAIKDAFKVGKETLSDHKLGGILYLMTFWGSIFYLTYFWVINLNDGEGDVFNVISLNWPFNTITLVVSAVVICLILGFVGFYSHKKIGRWNILYLIISTGLLGLLSALYWYLNSYNYYYNGVESGYLKTALTYHRATSIILNKHATELEKKAMLKELYSTSQGEFVVIKNGEEYVKKATGRDKRYYQMDDFGDNAQFTPIRVGDDIYVVKYFYGNRPYWDVGITRAITLSTIPDLGDWYFDNDGHETLKKWEDQLEELKQAPTNQKKIKQLESKIADKKVELENKKNQYNAGYVRNRLYQRSINYWIPFYVLLLLWGTTSIHYIYKKIEFDSLRNEIKEKDKSLREAREEAELKRIQLQAAEEERDKTSRLLQVAEEENEKTNRLLSEKQNEYAKMNNNLGALFLRAYSHMAGETRQIEAEGRNTLQELSSNCCEPMSDEDITLLDERLEMAAKKERHDLKNKWISDPVYQNNEVVQKYINKVLKGLEGIAEAISIKMVNTPLNDVLREIEKHNLTYEDGASGFTYSINVPKRSYYMTVNLHHFCSIIDNLVGNAKEATQRRKNELRKQKVLGFKRSTFFNVYSTEEKDGTYLNIKVEDNGGGFKDVEKIYNEVILSSKLDSNGQQRLGEGTSYIRMFTEMMNGKINAENIVVDGDIIGARTLVRFKLNKGEILNG